MLRIQKLRFSHTHFPAPTMPDPWRPLLVCFYPCNCVTLRVLCEWSHALCAGDWRSSLSTMPL